MGADIADQVTPLPMSPTLGQTLTRAAQYAQEQSHAEVALDHLLLSLTEDDDARQVMASSGVNIAALQTDVSQQIGRIDARLAPEADATVTISEELRRILNAAAVAARAGRRAMIDGAIVLAAIIGDAKTSAAGLLRAHGLTFEVAINVIKQASRPAPPAAPARTAAGHQAESTEPVTSPLSPQPPSATNDILAEARSRIASKKAAGYSDQVAAKKSAEEAAARADEERPTPQLDAMVSDPAAGQDDDAVTGKAKVASESVEAPDPFNRSETDSEGHISSLDDSAGLQLPSLDPPASLPAAAAAPPPFSPPPVVTPPAQAEQRPAPTPPVRRPPSSPPPTPPPPPKGAQSWAPPPSGPPPTPAGPPPRGAPPPIPPGMPSRPPAPVPTGRHPLTERRLPDPGTQSAPPGQNARREPPWPGQSAGSPSQQPAGPIQSTPSSAGPLPSPEEVFATNSRARSEADRAQSRQRTRPGSEPADRASRRRERAAEPAPTATVLPGQLIENVPRRMCVGISAPVEVRIAKAEVKAISDGLDLNATHRHDIQVTKAMSVRLRAPEGGFFIETASPETQWIENALGLMADDFARWRWTVTPKLRGKRRLQLIVSARTVGPDGLAAETALPDQIIEIKVAANYTKLAKHMAGWTVAAVLGGLLAQFGAQIWSVMEPLLRALIQQ